MNQDSLVDLRKQVIIASSKAKEGHIPSALSILDILYVIYAKFIDKEKVIKNDIDRDRFVLSKGHASLGLYVVLINAGILPENSLDDFGSYNSILGGHPDTNKVIGVEASTGSLGHGFPIAVGMALGYKIKSIKSRVFALIGDGECNEGTVWEAALLANHHNLSNLTCIVDFNHSTDRALDMGDIASKFKSFGWHSLEINGHNHKEIEDALSNGSTTKPTAIIANTIKGYGCIPMEGKPEWHHKSPSSVELEDLLKQLRL